MKISLKNLVLVTVDAVLEEYQDYGVSDAEKFDKSFPIPQFSVWELAITNDDKTNFNLVRNFDKTRLRKVDAYATILPDVVGFKIGDKYSGKYITCCFSQEEKNSGIELDLLHEKNKVFIEKCLLPYLQNEQKFQKKYDKACQDLGPEKE